MEENGASLPTRVAALVHAHFDALPAHYKPRTRNGTTEWIPMSGIVAVKGQGTPSETLTCVTVTTGARCLSYSQIPHCRGLVLHDSHAEVLAIRAFNYWLLNECLSVLQQEKSDPNQRDVESIFIRRRTAELSNTSGPPFEICPDVKLYMYCTCAPCGDASMELCMAEQDDPTPWVVPPKNGDEDQQILLDGRAHFSILGVVRRKPARGDAEVTRSKSCSDKLALRQVTSLLSYPASLLVAPTSSAYISAYILPEEEISRTACDRAFGPGSTGRMKSLVGTEWPVVVSRENDSLAYRFRPFEVLSVPMESIRSKWPFGKYRSDSARPASGAKSKPGNVSAVWIAANSSQKPYKVTRALRTDYLPRVSSVSTAVSECIVNGVKQGSKISSITPRGASVLSRAKMWDFVCDILALSGTEGTVWQDLLEMSSYREFKSLLAHKVPWMRARFSVLEDAKRVLRPWIPNRGDEDWSRSGSLAIDKENMKKQI